MEDLEAQNKQKIRLDLAYDGTNFHGWAEQPGLRTVQGELQTALALLMRRSVNLTVAGRTDAGVHARGQVAHFDLLVQDLQLLSGQTGADSQRLEVHLRRRLNRILQMQGAVDVILKKVHLVDDTFDARFSALYRRYIYRLAPDPQAVDPLRRDVYCCPETNLDLATMQQAVQPLVGEHDFYHFSKPRPGASTIRCVQKANWEVDNQGLWIFTIQADAFTHSMVRSIVGATLLVGRGRRSVNWLGDLLSQSSKLENPSGKAIAPARGLTLEKVGYPESKDWAQQQVLTRRYRGEELESCEKKED